MDIVKSTTFSSDDRELLLGVAPLTPTMMMVGGGSCSDTSSSSTTATPTSSSADKHSPPPPTAIGDLRTALDPQQQLQQCTCQECGKVFNSVWYLKQHAVKHSNDRPFKCKWCHKTYKFRSNLYQHKCPNRVKQAGGQRRGRKPAVTDTYLTDNLLHLPTSLTTETSGWSATNGRPSNDRSTENGGDYANDTVQSLRNNTNYLSPASSYRLPQYANGVATTSDREAFLSHLQRSIERKNAAATPTMQRRRSSDPAVLADQAGLSKLQVQQYIEKFKNMLHQCRKCKVYFPSREYLSRHMASHSFNDAAHKCRCCSERFDSESACIRHSRKHIQQSKHRCHVCSGLFRSQLSLRKHLHASGRCLEQRPPSSATPNNPLAFIDHNPPEVNEKPTDVCNNVDLPPLAVVAAAGSCSSELSNSSSSDASSSAGSHGPSPANSVELGVFMPLPTNPSPQSPNTTMEAQAMGNNGPSSRQTVHPVENLNLTCGSSSKLLNNKSSFAVQGHFASSLPSPDRIIKNTCSPSPTSSNAPSSNANSSHISNSFNQNLTIARHQTPAISFTP